jgi:hypothetical protein
MASRQGLTTYGAIRGVCAKCVREADVVVTTPTCFTAGFCPTIPNGKSFETARYIVIVQIHPIAACLVLKPGLRHPKAQTRLRVSWIQSAVYCCSATINTPPSGADDHRDSLRWWIQAARRGEKAYLFYNTPVINPNWDSKSSLCADAAIAEIGENA